MKRLAIQIKYSCKGCGIVKAVVTVEARTDGEDVVAWVRRAVDSGISRDHQRRSPLCQSKTCDIMVPIEGDGVTPVGAPVKPR